MALEVTGTVVTLEVFIEDGETNTDIPKAQAIQTADAWIAEHEPNAGWVRETLTRYWSGNARAVVVYQR